ncbi:MAG: helix-turn-helix domain-containing protein [Bdellovibrionales bacterium]|nr:helix-turn-helix domain-containing protein [Bdellovibrionales bacterium]
MSDEAIAGGGEIPKNFPNFSSSRLLLTLIYIDSNKQHLPKLGNTEAYIMEKLKEAKLMNTSEAASYLGVKVSRLRTATRRRELPFMKVGRLVRFEKQHLDEWIERKHHAEVHHA